MKRWKKYTGLLLTLALCLSMMACGNSKKDDDDNKLDIGRFDDDDPDIGGDDVGGTDWRTTGIWRSDGTITRNGEDTDVLVCINSAEANFYYDMEDQVLYDYVDYPITLTGDAWDAFLSIDFSDITGDGNSDVTMSFNDCGNDLLMVWFWNAESYQFEFWPEASQLGENNPNGGFGNGVPGESNDVYSEYEGVWITDSDERFGWTHIVFDAFGNWQLYSYDQINDEGCLSLSDQNTTCMYSYHGGAVDGCNIELENGQLYIVGLGYFNYSGQHVSEFKGTWYLENELDAESFIIIDEYGSWEYYQRTVGDAEATQIDYGTLNYSATEGSIIYADSSMYNGVQYMVVDFDNDVIIWGDEGTYYRME